MTTPAATYTYSGDPSTSLKDTVRFLAQATGTDKETGFVSDQEIAWILTQEGNPYLAAARIAERISSVFGAKQTKTVGPLTISYKEQADSYFLLAKSLRDQANSTGAVGAQMTGNTTALFEVGMHDAPDRGVSPNPYNTVEWWPT